MTMMTGDKMTREDGKEFVVTTVAFWSTITAADGETASVKWYGGDDFVSSNGKGFTYVVSEDTRRKRFAVLNQVVDVAIRSVLKTSLARFDPVHPNPDEVVASLEALRDEVESLTQAINTTIAACKEVD